MSKIIIVDSNALINRAYFAIQRSMITKEGIRTNAIYGFFSMIFKIQKNFNPEYLVCCFDLKGKTFRHEMYGDYKKGRKPAEEDLIKQFPLIKDILRAMKIPICEKQGFEADDLIGTLALKAVDRGIDPLIITGDRDLLQLVSEKINVCITVKGMSEYKIFDEKKMEEEYGFLRESFVDYKALMGDKSDNIPGVKGIGEKTAGGLILKYKTVDDILKNVDIIENKKVAQKIKDDKENLLMSKELATIKVDVDIDFDDEEFKVKQPDYDEVITLYKKLELNNFLRDLENKDVIVHKETKNQEQLFGDVAKELGKFELAEDFIIQNEKEIIGHDIKEFFKKNKIVKLEKKIFDIKIAAHLLSQSKTEITLEKICHKYLEIDIKEIEDMKKAILKLKKILLKKLEEEDLLFVFNKIEMPLIMVLSVAENVGVAVNKKVLTDIGDEISNTIENLTKEIYRLAGKEFNIASPKQLSEVLFEDLKLTTGKKTKTFFSTNNEVLESISLEHEIIEKILEYRSITKIKGTYVDGLIPYIKEDGRIHTTFLQEGTTTGRLSSKDPNVQNLPVRDGKGKEIRKAFTAGDGKIFVSADYSQIELRVLAHLSNDKEMIKDFTEGLDIHTRTAVRMFNADENDVSPLLRRRAKAINFGIVYGMGSFSLSKDVGISVKEAERYINNYFNIYSGVFNFINQAIYEGTTQGFVRTMLGRKRIINEILATNKNTKKLGERLAVNTKIQGTAADIIKIAMVNIYDKLSSLEATQILQIHDEIIIETSQKDAEQVKEILTYEMENAYKLLVPLTVNLSVGKNMYELK